MPQEFGCKAEIPGAGNRFPNIPAAPGTSLIFHRHAGASVTVLIYPLSSEGNVTAGCASRYSLCASLLVFLLPCPSHAALLEEKQQKSGITHQAGDPVNGNHSRRDFPPWPQSFPHSLRDPEGFVVPDLKLWAAERRGAINGCN